ncbi:MAG: SPASM domain-containing protein [Nanoarchaeota archaeon]|nr:SPASM domain-containing protein [Nanoarchaeota archaeon]
MPTMSLSHKLRLFSNFILAGRFREIYNMFWVYPLWWNRKTASFLLNKFLPKLGIDLFPPFLEIEPTTVCNFKCVCCEHSYWKEPSKNITFEQFKKIFDGYGKPKWLGLTGIGSSYLNKDYHKMMAYAKSKGTIIEVFDHFAHFKDDKEIKELIKIGPDFQFISTYGATKKSFEKVCRGSNYELIEKNIRKFVQIKKQMKARFPILSFHYIITKDSKEEVLQFLDFIHSLNTDIGEVLITPMLHNYKEAEKYAVEIDESYVRMVRERAQKYKIPVTVNMAAKQDSEGLERKPSINNCKEYIMPFIFVTGHVTPCCAQNEDNQRDWQKKLSLGNALEKPFREIWYSPRYKAMRKAIRQNKFSPACSHCPAYELRNPIF